MKLKSNTKRYSIFALAATFFVAVFTAVGLLLSDVVANAERSITLTGSNYFYTSNNAEVDEYCLDSSADTYYTGFVFSSDDDYVTYRKNLAYNWYADSDGDGTAEEGLFSLTIGFADITSFSTFTIKFQSQQYTLTEDAVTTNYLTFISDSTKGCVYVLTTTDEPTEEEIDEAEQSDKSHEYSYEKITISFVSYDKGVYTLSVTDGSTTSNDGSETSDETYIYTLENVGSTYVKYVSSSSSTSVIPLTFSASGVSDSSSAEMILYDLNGQSFELEGDAGDMTVTDNTPPVLCLDDDLTSVRYGYSLELNYAVIDVLATSPRTTINYYVLTNGQAEDSTLDLNSSDDNEYVSVSTSDTYAFIDSSTNIEYVDDEEENARLNRAFMDASLNSSSNGYTTKCLVKIYFTIADSTSSNGVSDEVYLDWYVNSDYLATVNSYNFIRAVTDEEGVSYTYTPIYTDDNNNITETCTQDTFTYSDLDALTAAYQKDINDAKDEQKPTAGDGNYFYLPSFEGYVTDNLTGYRDLTYSIYYVAGSDTSVSSNTSLDSNELAIELSTDGTYRFVIFATDGQSNDMYYWSYEEQADSSYAWEKITFTSSDLSAMLSDNESELWDYVPYFEFTVNYEGLVVEDTEAQEIAYVDTEYTASSFDITGLNSGYSTSYTLYVFDRQAYSEDNKTTISYSQILNYINTYVGQDGEDWFTKYSKYFTLITAYADLEETDEYYDDYCDYEWDPDSLSFVPQDENTFYVIRLVVEDETYHTSNIVKYMVISSSAAAEELTGESRWLQDNLASVILLSVAGAALIGIILLIVIKPKEKGDIDVIDLNEEDKKSRKKIAKSKKSDDLDNE